MFGSDADALPITEVNLELNKPCLQSREYYSELSNNDISIYQSFERRESCPLDLNSEMKYNPSFELA
jgi:hypothetical protein